jgi:hypothetical protein
MTKPLFRALSGTALALGLLFAPLLSAFAGQTITINGNNVADDVFGNGNPPDGFWNETNPADLLDPNNNTVIISNNSLIHEPPTPRPRAIA